MSARLILAFAIVVIITEAMCYDYCAPDLCYPGKRHIACGHTGRFAAQCPRDARIVPMTQEFKEVILNEHNKKRSLIASGNLKGYQPAARMATMQWDDELASLATLNVMQCQMKHDQCRNTRKFRMAGQNLAYQGYSGDESRMSNTELMKTLINDWFEEYKNADMTFIKKYPERYSGATISHFTTMVTDRNANVGCAIARYKEDIFNTFLIACNYESTNIVGQPVYVAGKTTSGCKTGRNPQMPSLCSKKEYNK